MKAHSRQDCDYLNNVILPERGRLLVWPRLSGLLSLPRQNRLGHAVAIDRGRESAINRNLPQDGGQFLVGQAIAQGTAKVRLELVHAAETGDHAEIEQAAVARLEILVGPH